MKKTVISLLLCACMLATAITPALADMIPTEPTNSVLREEIACDAPLPFTASYATVIGSYLYEPVAFEADVNEALATYCGGITTESTTGLPCQCFSVDTTGVTSDAVVLTLAAATVENERMAMKVFNTQTETWDTVDTAVTEGRLGAKIAIADYADDNGTIEVMLVPDYVQNGSNTMIWSTDQQHYTKHDDLNYIYSDIHKYMVEEYQKNNIAYVVNTGDIVDDMPYMLDCSKQWQVADKAFAVLDEAGVPYGIETGNHDVGDYPVNCYDFYLTYFAEERYADKPWFGGTMNDNMCHYDLVTVGNIDFLMLYLGYGIEGDADVIDWANEVIAMYPHRSVVVCTHQNLRPNTMKRGGRGDDIYRYIVEPNDNVVMVLSGHYDGAAYTTTTLDDGRIIQEVIADYQFVQAEAPEYYEGHEDPLHHIGDTPHCNGEGYIREVTFNGDTVTMYAKSPVTGGETPFGLRDDITLTLTHPETKRQVTSYQFAAVVPNPNKGADSLEKFTLDDGSKAFAYTADGESDKTLSVNADKGGLQNKITFAQNIDTAVYTTDSVSAFKAALGNAQTVLADANGDFTGAYRALADAIGDLVKFKESISPEGLTVVHELDLNDYAWKNANGPSKVTSPYSETTFTSNDNGGFTAVAASGEGWPQIQYIAPITFTPENGRVYLNLDIEAGSTWSFYPRIIQDGQQFTGRLNYVIEGSYDKLFDAGSGNYKGVFEITQGLADLGVDLTKEMTLSIDVNVVPGPVTINKMAVLTGEPKPPVAEAPADTVADEKGGMDMTTIILIVVGAVVIIGLALFAILYKPKKKAE